MEILKKANPHVFVFYPSNDQLARSNAEYIVEGGRTLDLGQKWLARMDPPHHTKMKPHCHVMLRGDDVSIINKDGTPSHGTTRDGVPSWVIDKIKAKGLIEGRLLVEANLSDMRLTQVLIEKAEASASIHDLVSTLSLPRVRGWLGLR